MSAFISCCKKTLQRKSNYQTTFFSLHCIRFPQMTLIFMIPAMFGYHTTYFIDISFIKAPLSVHPIELTSLDIGVCISMWLLIHVFGKLTILHNFCIYFSHVNIFFDGLIPRQRIYSKTELHFHLKSVFFFLSFNAIYLEVLPSTQLYIKHCLL